MSIVKAYVSKALFIFPILDINWWSHLIIMDHQHKAESVLWGPKLNTFVKLDKTYYTRFQTSKVLRTKTTTKQKDLLLKKRQLYHLIEQSQDIKPQINITIYVQSKTRK
jgi:hypothetical protein